MISPRDARRYIEEAKVSYGTDVTLPDDIDTSECGWLFGTRCPHNVHVKGRRIAHIDRVDPRHDPIGHLEDDVRIPHTVVTTSIGAAAGAAAGAILGDNGNRRKAALAGTAAGAAAGFIVGWLQTK